MSSDSHPRAPHVKEEAPTLRLADRITLRPLEAAETLGVSERTLRQLLPELPHFHTEKGGRGCVLIPVESLKRWVEARAEAEGNRVERLAAEIERAFSK